MSISYYLVIAKSWQSGSNMIGKVVWCVLVVFSVYVKQDVTEHWASHAAIIRVDDAS